MSISLRQARRMKDFSMREMASKLGVCECTYRKLERNPGEISIDNAKAICKILDISIDQIFFDSNSSLTRGTKEA